MSNTMPIKITMTFWIEKDEKAAPAGVSYIEVIIV
jgi:hypothetical protein